MQFLKSLIQGSFSKFPSLIFQRHKFRVESEAVKPKPFRTRADFKLESIILVVMSVRTKSLLKQIELYGILFLKVVKQSNLSNCKRETWKKFRLRRILGPTTDWATHPHVRSEAKLRGFISSLEESMPSVDTAANAFLFVKVLGEQLKKEVKCW